MSTFAPVILQPSIWQDFKTTLRAVFSTVVTAATTTEKVVQLAENEVDNLNEQQLIRLDQTKADRKVQRAAIKAALQ